MARLEEQPRQDRSTASSLSSRPGQLSIFWKKGKQLQRMPHFTAPDGG